MINMIDHLMKRFWNNRIPIKHAVHVCSFLISTFEGIGLMEQEDGEESKFVIYLRSHNNSQNLWQRQYLNFAVSML